MDPIGWCRWSQMILILVLNIRVLDLLVFRQKYPARIVQFLPIQGECLSFSSLVFLPLRVPYNQLSESNIHLVHCQYFEKKIPFGFIVCLNTLCDNHVPVFANKCALIQLNGVHIC